VRLKVLLPHRVLLDRNVQSVTARGADGAFGLLEHHADFVSVLAPGILTFIDREGAEEHAALDAGVLVKNGSEVLVSARDGVAGRPLGRLRQAVEEEFAGREAVEERAQQALAKMEAGFVRRLVELGHE
jgi:F-type H+-transporting ATPase subunit epsilon